MLTRELESAMKSLRLQYEQNFTNESYGYIEPKVNRILEATQQFLINSPVFLTKYKAKNYSYLKDKPESDRYYGAACDVYKSIEKLVDIYHKSPIILGNVEENYFALPQWIEFKDYNAGRDDNQVKEIKIKIITINDNGKKVLEYWKKTSKRNYN